MRKHEKRLKELASRYGGELARRGNGHLCIVTKDGHKLTTSASPKNPDTALRQLERDLRRYA